MRRGRRSLVAAVMAVSVAAAAAVGVASGNHDTVIEIGASPSGRTVSKGLFGANHRYPFEAFGSFTDDGRPEAGLVAQGRAAGITNLRYPGGTVANTFRWKRAIGPQDGRRCQTGGGDGAPLESTVGPDEHMALVEQMGAGTSLVVNFATGTPQEAADWVSYMNAPVCTSPWADLRAKHGHPEPYGVTWWEVGNEPDVGDQAYWMEQHASIAPGEHPARARKYAFGGSTRFKDQPLTTDCDRRKGADVSDGQAAQERQIAYPPVSGTVQVTVDGERWREVDSLAQAGPDDRVHTLDRSTGRVRFGDGTRGAVPAKGTTLAVSYTSGPHPGYVDFVGAMKAADPDIRVCSSYQGSAFVEAIGRNPALDCQVSHPYTWLLAPMTAAQTHDYVMMGSDWQAAHVAEEQQALRQGTGRNIPLLVSEYGASPVPGIPTWKEPGGDYLASLSPALYVASQLTAFARAGVPAAMKHSLIDLPAEHDGDATSTNLGSRNVAIFGPSPEFNPSPTAQVLAMLSPLTGSAVLPATVRDNPQRTAMMGRYPALVTLAVRPDDDTLTVVVVNRDPRRSVTAALDLPAAYAEVVTETLHADDFDAVDVRRKRATRDVDADRLTHDFPEHSLTIMNFSR